MLLTFLFLANAIVGGSVLTYLYDGSMRLASRLCTGACTGLAVLATVGFVAASIMGFNPASLLISGGILALPWLVLLQEACRARFVKDLREAGVEMRRAFLHPSLAMTGYAAFYLAVSLFLGFVFAHVLFTRSDGIYTGLVNNLGDLPFHLQIISSFAHGENFPPQDPAYTGVRFAYPFLADFLTAMLMKTGASLVFAMWIQNFVLGISLVGMMHYWTLKLTRDRLAGVIAPMLILLSGGIGWWLLFADLSSVDTGLTGLLHHLPHDYTIQGGTVWRWGNSLTTLFVPQRSILFGVPVAIFVFTQWWLALEPTAALGSDSSASREAAGVVLAGESSLSSTPGHLGWTLLTRAPARRMLAAGVFTGMLPLIHAHSFVVVIGMAGCLALLFKPWRLWLAFLIPALLIAVPEMLWSTHDSAVNMRNFVVWHVGWDRGAANPVAFWLLNTGVFIPLLVAAVLWSTRGDDLVPSFWLRFYLPFLLCFALPNLLTFAPWVWDNIKVLFYWYLASIPLVALLLATWLKRSFPWRVAAIALLFALTFAGSLDLLRVLTGTTEYREFDRDGISIAQEIIQRTEPRALVLHAPTYNPPVFLTGRHSLLGYPGSIWSRGLDYPQRLLDIQHIYAGAPEAQELMRRYQVNYVLISPLERGTLMVNEGFWSQFPLVARSGEYRLYRIDLPK